MPAIAPELKAVKDEKAECLMALQEICSEDICLSLVKDSFPFWVPRRLYWCKLIHWLCSSGREDTLCGTGIFISYSWNRHRKGTSVEGTCLWSMNTSIIYYLIWTNRGWEYEILSREKNYQKMSEMERSWCQAQRPELDPWESRSRTILAPVNCPLPLHMWCGMPPHNVCTK